jgi:hypothetical protein
MSQTNSCASLALNKKINLARSTQVLSCHRSSKKMQKPNNRKLRKRNSNKNCVSPTSKNNQPREFNTTIPCHYLANKKPAKDRQETSKAQLQQKTAKAHRETKKIKTTSSTKKIPPAAQTKKNGESQTKDCASPTKRNQTINRASSINKTFPLSPPLKQKTTR